MGKKPAGLRAFEAYDQLPARIKRHTNRLIKIGAKATKTLRDRELIEKRGKAFTNKIKKRLKI